MHSRLDSDSSSGVASLKPLGPGDVYHVSVQPCFDRKIEASRPYFEAPDAEGVREVDTVLTTGELLELLQGSVSEETASEDPAAALFTTLPDCSPDSETLTDVFLGSLCTSNARLAPLLCAVRGENAGAGGFLEHVFRQSAAKLFKLEVDSPLAFKVRQNEDMREVALEDPHSNEVLLRFVSAYGFRNIQKIIRRMTKPGSKPRKECGDFVEIMACPGGCLNGAGQVTPPKKDGAAPTQSNRRERLEALEDLLCNGEGVAVVPPIEHPLVPALYSYIASRAPSATPHNGTADSKQLDKLIGGSAVRSFLEASWRSLKVDSEGNAIVGTSALKW